MTNEDENRQQGVEFGEFGDAMDSFDYPVKHASLIADHGDAELELPNGQTTLEAVLEPIDERTYEDREDLETMVMNMVDDDAIGRENYSDRDSSGIGDESDDERSL